MTEWIKLTRVDAMWSRPVHLRTSSIVLVEAIPIRFGDPKERACLLVGSTERVIVEETVDEVLALLEVRT